jgi:hypothetical protein
MSYDESLLQILREKKKEDIDEDRCFLLSLLPSFRQFNDEQKFLAPMEILKIMRHIKLSQNMHTYSSYSLPSFSDASNVPPNTSHFETNPLNPQPGPSMPNSDILSQYLSIYPIDPQRPQTSTTVLPQYPHISSSPTSSNAPVLIGEDGSSDVSSLLSLG